MNSGQGSSVPLFRDAFCRRFGCAPTNFEKAILRRCFPPIVRPLGTILLTLRPEMFRRELTMLARLAASPSESALRGELEGYVYENERDKPFRVRTLGLRLSRRRFVRIYRNVMGGSSPGRENAPTPV